MKKKVMKAAKQRRRYQRGGSAFQRAAKRRQTFQQNEPDTDLSKPLSIAPPSTTPNAPKLKATSSTKGQGQLQPQLGKQAPSSPQSLQGAPQASSPAPDQIQQQQQAILGQNTNQAQAQTFTAAEPKIEVMQDFNFWENAEQTNGRLAMIGFFAAVHNYILFGAVIPGIF